MCCCITPARSPLRRVIPQVDVEEELDEAARAVREELKSKYLRPDDLQQYAIAGAGGGAGEGA